MGGRASPVSAADFSSFFCVHRSSPHVEHAANMYLSARNLMDAARPAAWHVAFARPVTDV
jgi:hypothetical protein